ncbi:hypothetical protein [Arthrobacter sp.]|uniref:hypothetical protein n=1 Tax=Arthrobacter sp. TaxID=1667 RepID=UPI003A92FEC0
MAKKTILAQKLALAAMLLLCLAAAILAFVDVKGALALVSSALLVGGGLVYVSSRNVVDSVRTVVRQEDRVVQKRDKLVTQRLAEVVQVVRGAGASPLNPKAAEARTASSETGGRAGGTDVELVLDVYAELRAVQNSLAGLRADNAVLRQEIALANDKLSAGLEANSI